MRALVLKKVPFQDTDLIVHFLLEDGRTASGFAAGARRSKKRFPHQFHPAGIYKVQWSPKAPEGRDRLRRLHACELESFVPELSDHLEGLSRWSMIMEWIAVDEGSEFDFEEILQVMRTLPSEMGVIAFHSFFAQQMKVHGLEPELNRCTICGKEGTSVPNERLNFVIHEGGIAHRRCSQGLPVDAETIDVFRKVLQFGPEELEPDSSEALERFKTLDALSLPYLEERLGITLKSRKFFEQLEPQSRASL